MSDLVPVVHSDAHLAHTGLIELASGVEIPCYESPERVLAIEAALLEDGGFAFEAPTEHGREPILAVHDADMVDVFEHAWTDALAGGATDGSRPWLPDTFLLAAYRGPMPPSQLPAGRHHRLGAYLFDTATPIVAGTWGARHLQRSTWPSVPLSASSVGRRSPMACAGRPGTTRHGAC